MPRYVGGAAIEMEIVKCSSFTAHREGLHS